MNCTRSKCANFATHSRLKLCQKHYLEWRGAGRTCQWQDCTRSEDKDALCSSHYLEWIHGGRGPVPMDGSAHLPGDNKGAALVTGWDGTAYLERYRVESSGYIMLTYQPSTGGRKRSRLEHRVMMENWLGRYLYRHEKVSHRNGVRDDNRLENLELWSTSKPGKSVAEKSEWARWWLEQYADVTKTLPDGVDNLLVGE